LIHCVWACIVEELEESWVKSTESVQIVWKEGGTRLLNDDVFQALGDFMLVCVAHGKVNILQGSGVEILLLD
jgi:hypothetical protein